MNQKFLMMVATICGAVVILSLLVLPMVTWGSGDSSGSRRVIAVSGGSFMLMFGWIAGGCAAMLFLKMNARIGMSDQACRIGSLIGFKLLAFFLIAYLINGADHGSWGIGYWLAFFASIVGAFAVYLTFNEKLAKKLADATKGDIPPGDTPSSDSVSSGTKQ